MGRIGRGWHLAKRSWSVVKGDRSLIVFPIVSAIAGIITAIIFFGAGAGLIAGTKIDWLGIVIAVIGVYLIIAIGIFCGVALSACAARALEGHDTTVGEGIAAARQHQSQIFAWAGVSLVVGGLIMFLEALLREAGGQILATIVGGLANFAWSVATFFVIPVIAFEDLGPKDAIKRSTHVVKERWGEGVTGSFAIGGIAFLIGILPAGILIAIGIAVAKSSVAFGVVVIVLGALVLVVAALLQATISAVFKVALFRFATEGKVLGGFEPQELEAAFVPKHRRL
jgi:hypothetical protein